MLKQQLSIKQNLSLSPSLQQGISILQMSDLELQTLISEEMIKNPFLKLENSDDTNILPAHEALINNEYYNSDNSDYDPFAHLSYKKSLLQHILEQIDLENIQPRNLAYFLAELLDDNGYIKADFGRICADLYVDAIELECLLFRLQKLDPAGVFARNLSECLTLQLKDQKIFDAAFEAILENLELVAQKKLSALSKICHLDATEIQERLKTLQKLNPKPGATFANEVLSYKLPNIIIETHNGRVFVSLAKVSKLTFDKEYYQSVKAQNDDDKAFLHSGKKSALQLIGNIKKRDETLLAVAEIIAEKQKNFFLKGMLFFNPITLGEVAEVLSMNESTISRAVAGKYVKAPWGMVYDMKFFFSSSVQSKNLNMKVSSTKVKELIKQMVEQEDLPMSDEDLSIELAKFNIKIARRTVTKYREAMGIAKSNFRKKIS